MPEDSFAAGLVGIVLDGRYRLDALLGEGGMGAVFRAHHLPTDRRVAVKLLKPHLTHDDTALERFAREARSTLRVDSPHAVKVLDFGITPGPQRDYYMALEYVDGRTVQKELEIDGPFAPARVVHIARQACHALGAAHAQGLVHRDIKPENIILTSVDGDPDFAKLLDFGVAKIMDGAARSDRSALALTMKGVVFGTCEFMSPEQACGKPVDARSDIYSLAATMFGMLTGCGMYQAQVPLDWLLHHVRTPAPHLAEGLAELAAYPELDALLQRCFAKHREARPQTAEELDRLLAEIEPTLGRGTAGAKRTAETIAPGKIKRAESSYVEALPEDTLDRAERASDPGLRTSAGAEDRASDLRPRTSAGTESTGAHVPARRGRGVALVIGAAAAAGLVIAAVVMAVGGDGEKKKPSALRPQGSGSGSQIAATPNPTPTPTPTPTPMPNPMPTPAHGSPEARGPKPEAPPAPAPQATALATHLAASEAAKASGNRLRQISEGDAALHIDPHNVRAHLLVADGLIATGANDSACKYLHGLGHHPQARPLIAAASCPGD